MIVYIESNFLLEMALEQEDAPAAEGILELAENGKCEIVIPSIAVYEPFSTLLRYGSERERLSDGIQRELRELNRQRPYKDLVQKFQPLVKSVREIERRQSAALRDVLSRVLKAAKVIELTATIFYQAGQFEIEFELSPRDAIVYASVMDDVARQSDDRPKCFISRNTKDFNDPKKIDPLKRRSCRYITNFSDGMSYIKSTLLRD